METKSRGQLAPIPSAAQKVPRLVRMIPTAYLRVFSGTRASGFSSATPAPPPPPPRRCNERHCKQSAGHRLRKVLAGAAHGDNDEDHLDALEEDALERDHEAYPVLPRHRALQLADRL